MAIAKVADRGTTANTTAEGSTVVTLTGNVSTGNYLIARVAVDNSGGGGAAPGLSVSGTAGNTWTVLGPALQDPGAASAGMTCFICYAYVTNAPVTGNTVSFDWTGTPTAKAIVLEEWSGIDDTNPIAATAATFIGATTTPSRTIVPTASGQLVYAALAVEGGTADTYTKDSDTTNGSWVLLTRAGAGTTTSGATINGEYKLVTATGTQTYNPTITARDWAGIGVVFAVGTPATPKTASDTLSITFTEGTTDKSAVGVVLTEDFEDATLDLTIVSNNWIRTTTQAKTGTWSWTNTDIADNQQSDAVITVPDGATSISFWYMVSSEGGWDYFRFFIAGVQQFQAAGSVAWTQANYSVTPGQQLTFRYMKDGTTSSGSDSAWVDDIVFQGTVQPPPTPQSAADTLTISFTDSATMLSAAEEKLAPDAILTQTNITGALTDIDEDPDSADNVWMDGTGAIVLRTSFPSPAQDLVSGFSQRFRVKIRPGTQTWHLQLIPVLQPL